MSIVVSRLRATLRKRKRHTDLRCRRRVEYVKTTVPVSITFDTGIKRQGRTKRKDHAKRAIRRVSSAKQATAEGRERAANAAVEALTASADAKKALREACETLESAAATLASGALFATLLSAVAALFKYLRSAAPASGRGRPPIHGVSVVDALSLVGAPTGRTARQYLGAALTLVARVTTDHVRWIVDAARCNLLSVRQLRQIAAFAGMAHWPSDVEFPTYTLAKLFPLPEAVPDPASASEAVKGLLQRTREAVALYNETASEGEFYSALERDREQLQATLARIQKRLAYAADRGLHVNVNLKELTATAAERVINPPLPAGDSDVKLLAFED